MPPASMAQDVGSSGVTDGPKKQEVHAVSVSSSPPRFISVARQRSKFTFFSGGVFFLNSNKKTTTTPPPNYWCTHPWVPTTILSTTYPYVVGGGFQDSLGGVAWCPLPGTVLCILLRFRVAVQRVPYQFTSGTVHTLSVRGTMVTWVAWVGS